MAAPTLYARRGYSYANGALTQPTTFVSWDEADNQPAGHFPGWQDDGEIEWHGRPHRLVHVYGWSWRVSEPQRLSTAEAA